MKRSRTGEAEPNYLTHLTPISASIRLTETQLYEQSLTQHYVLEDDPNKTLYTTERKYARGSRVTEKQTNRTRIFVD